MSDGNKENSKSMHDNPHVMHVKAGDAFYAPPGVIVHHLPDDADRIRQLTSAMASDLSEFESLYSSIHPATPRTLFERVVSNERYCSMEVEHACRMWMLMKERANNEAIDAAKSRLLSAMPHFRKALADAGKNGAVKLGILSETPDGGGRIEMRFECEDFFADIQTVIGAKPQNMEDDAKATALKFLQTHGLTVVDRT